MFMIYSSLVLYQDSIGGVIKELDDAGLSFTVEENLYDLFAV